VLDFQSIVESRGRASCAGVFGIRAIIEHFWWWTTNRGGSSSTLYGLRARAAPADQCRTGSP
jgi:hypothetical protein